MIDLRNSEVVIANNTIIFKDGKNNILEVPMKLHYLVMPTANFKSHNIKCQIRLSSKQTSQINDYLAQSEEFINEIKNTLL
ncbi:hypothetical protein ACT8O7_07960 [Ornithobacterium rhinotracheale]|uniref:hypothetical protein n=1 Tax=Ornithobacterium rhinotracheale TaxID=28251 RepID=UPI004036732A